MHAMQYDITLPADYDMEIIRKRVATRGHLLDGFPGLGLKAYLIRERGALSPVAQYAPFYLWTAPEGMNSFLWGPGFQGIVDDFGRPEVRHWTGLAYEEGPASVARTAVRDILRLPPSAGLPELMDEAVRETERLAGLDGAVCAALAVDPRHWELVRFSLWDHESPTAPGDRFEVLRLCAPHRAELPRGRQW
ncbi:DUF4865 family protein [Streptomyces sp. AM 4-1-1]|uniref:DUF4865 family protein n=1 Tax=unclassified Streptomyces TaxID=2593676 RepID=UPI0023B93AE5|nr:DUF4865 family protein [Streptomyces sp. AM 4-1-1]WEH32138.1 DUF4865 family protein [Streptomyces sp. AM 4-1-1]